MKKTYKKPETLAIKIEQTEILTLSFALPQVREGRPDGVEEGEDWEWD